MASADITGASILEIGSGVGHLHQTLLEQGARFATGVDLAEAMIAEAKDWARQRGLESRTCYHVGDFIGLTNELPDADIVVLDKVVCCYPDARELITASAIKARTLYALTYPRDRWFVRAGITLSTFMLRLIRSNFRPYLHSHTEIDNWLKTLGFRKEMEKHTFIWVTQIYRKT